MDADLLSVDGYRRTHSWHAKDVQFASYVGAKA
jgi:hypothetical protein